MSIWNEDSGYYCLLIAILCEVNVTEAKLIYKYGPGHPVSRRIFDKKLKMEDAENMEKETMGNMMYRMRKEGYTLEEIQAALQHAGMEFLGAWDADTKGEPHGASERIYAAARERGKTTEHM